MRKHLHRNTMFAVVAAELVQMGTSIAVPIGIAATTATLVLELRLASKTCAPRLPDGSIHTSATASRGLYALISALVTLGLVAGCHCIDWANQKKQRTKSRYEGIELQAMLAE
jgi:hypothetical protein